MIAVIGGSGLGEAFAEQGGGETIEVDTPFGPPSAPLVRTHWGGAEIIFLNRHGVGHCYSPSAVPYRANIFALKMVGVTTVIASGAVGSLREEIQPGHLVICDQAIDKTFRRAGTFYHGELAVHVELADPFCPVLRERIIGQADRVEATVHRSGTYVCMEGPQFSTRAESQMHRDWGGDVIGMTAMPEAKLAREAELSYALVALPTDYDCWRPPHTRDRRALLAEIMGNLKQATQQAIVLIQAVIADLHRSPIDDCDAFRALELGIWTDKSVVSPQTIERLHPLIGRYFDDRSV
ncbi:MAG: S-methyl-5'-thioadenosine phosphorylase [Planctomycetes bacterium]|nr:S-methyl-5'-thioadenosine phosphorylase [Planctomycetota bacterium]